MITRLLELRLSAFRAFQKEQIIPLDADVILIHGTNGTAKTSLLSGLEFALTGEVFDLQRYAADYPRCLKHLGAVEDSSAAIRYRDAKGEEREITHVVTSKGGTPSSSFTLTPDEKCFFLDRCYLSQSSLSRLLENYQASDTDQPEQPLVRFVRELLGLDLLENLTSGLHEAGNITRMEKSVTSLRLARETESNSLEQVTQLEERRVTRAAVWSTALAELQRVAGEVGDVLPEKPWDVAGIEARLKGMDDSASYRTTAERLQSLRRAEGRLQNSLGLLGDDENVVGRARLEEQLTVAESKRTELSTRLQHLVARAQSMLLELGRPSPNSDDLVATLQATTIAIGEARDQLEAGVRRLAALNADLSKLRFRADEIATGLKSHPPSTRKKITERQRLAELLAAISQHIHGEECPVCARDYSEIGAGTLSERIASEIAKIGADAHTLEERERQRAALEAEDGDIKRRIGALEQQLAKEPLIGRDDAQRQSLISLATECTNAEPERQSLSRLTLAVATFRSELSILDTRRKQRTVAAGDLGQLARDIGLVTKTETTAGQIKEITAHLAAAIGKAERQLAGTTRLRDALTTARTAGLSLEQVDKELIDVRRRQEQAGNLVQQMRGLIQEGKDLAKAAANAKTKLLDQVFNETLNRLWHDFFRRLAKSERFQPWLGEPTYFRGQIRTTIEGRAPNAEPFSQFAAVASSGNVTTAALSLYLALHLIEQPRHRVLVLDDPVQNMDDVRVVQLAGLLRKIGRSAERQIVIAVHERALFDYLCLELSPTQPNGKLLALELHRTRLDGPPTLTSTEHVWKGDLLKFGVAG